MSRAGTLRALLAVAVVSVAVVAAGQVGAPLTEPEHLLGTGALQDAAGPGEAAGPARQPVTAAALVCPGPEQQGLADPSVPELAQRVLLQAVSAPENLLPEVAVSTAEGSVVLDPTGDTANVSTQERAAVAALDLTGAEGAVVSADGGLAAGLTASQAFLSPERQQRGLSVTPCVEPTEEAWLLAGGGDPGRTERLVLLNPGADPVTATVRVLGGGGSAARAEDVVVPAGGRVVSLLDGLSPGVAAPGVQVTTSGGPVAAFLGETWLEGSTDRGTELTSPVSAPATSVVLPGVRVDGGEGAGVLLRVAVPGDEQAVAQVRALTAEGPVPVAQEVTLVPDGGSQDIALDDLAPGAYALEVSSDVPVVAAALSRSPVGEAKDAATRLESGGRAGPGGASDVAWAGSTDPVAGLAGTVLPDLPGPPLEAALHLVAGRAQTVGVALVAPDGTVRRQEVTVAADSTAVVAAGAARSVWVLPTDDDLRAAVTLGRTDPEGDLRTTLPLRSLPLTRSLTTVLPAAG